MTNRCTQASRDILVYVSSDLTEVRRLFMKKIKEKTMPFQGVFGASGTIVTGGDSLCRRTMKCFASINGKSNTRETEKIKQKLGSTLSSITNTPFHREQMDDHFLDLEGV